MGGTAEPLSLQGCRAGQSTSGVAAPPRSLPPPPSPLRSEGTGGRQRPGSASTTGCTPPRQPGPAPRRRAHPALAAPRSRCPAAGTHRRPARAAWRPTSGPWLGREAITPPAGRAASAAPVSGGTSHFSPGPRSPPAGGGRLLPRRLRLRAGGCLSCRRAAGRQLRSASPPLAPRPGAPPRPHPPGRGGGCAPPRCSLLRSLLRGMGAGGVVKVFNENSNYDNNKTHTHTKTQTQTQTKKPTHA